MAPVQFANCCADAGVSPRLARPATSAGSIAPATLGLTCVERFICHLQREFEFSGTERDYPSDRLASGTSLALRPPQIASPPELHASAFRFWTTHVSSVRRRTIERAPAWPFDQRPVAQCRVARRGRRPDRRHDRCARETAAAA